MLFGNCVMITIGFVYFDVSCYIVDVYFYLCLNKKKFHVYGNLEVIPPIILIQRLFEHWETSVVSRNLVLGTFGDCWLFFFCLTLHILNRKPLGKWCEASLVLNFVKVKLCLVKMPILPIFLIFWIHLLYKDVSFVRPIKILSHEIHENC